MALNPDLNGALTATTLLNKHVLVAAGTQTGVGVDLTGYVGNLMIVLSAAGANTDGGATITYSLLDSADNTTFTALTTPTFAAVTAASTLATVALDPKAVRRYVQFKALTTSTTATFTTSAVMVGLKNRVGSF
jgi:hypothetical protein